MAIAFVNSAGGTNVTANTCPVTYAPTAGNTLVVCSVNAGAQTVSSITTNVGGTFVLGNRGTNTNHAEVWTCLSCPSGVTTVTVTYSASTTSSAVIVGEYSGVSSIGTTPVNTSGTSTTPNQTFTLTAANNWLATNLSVNGNPAVTPTNGNTRRTQANSTTFELSLVDNTAASASLVTNKITIASAIWVGVGVQLIAPVASTSHLFASMGVGQ